MTKPNINIVSTLLTTLMLALLSLPFIAHAADIHLLGLTPNKALLAVDSNPPKMYSVGSMVNTTTRLVSTDRNAATFESNGKKFTLQFGQTAYRSNAAKSESPSITMQADERGHFTVTGVVNGGSSLRMLVDTGATMVTMPAYEAKRLGIDYKKGRIGRANTANGSVPVYLVKLDSLKIGDIELFQVDALVQEEGLSVVLLGMSFLKRLSMVREGEQMILTKKS